MRPSDRPAPSWLADRRRRQWRRAGSVGAGRRCGGHSQGKEQRDDCRETSGEGCFHEGLRPGPVRRAVPAVGPGEMSKQIASHPLVRLSRGRPERSARCLAQSGVLGVPTCGSAGSVFRAETLGRRRGGAIVLGTGHGMTGETTVAVGRSPWTPTMACRSGWERSTLVSIPRVGARRAAVSGVARDRDLRPGGEGQVGEGGWQLAMLWVATASPIPNLRPSVTIRARPLAGNRCTSST